MRAYAYMSPAARDARAERRIAQAEAHGLPPQHDADVRQPIELDLSCVGGERMTLRPIRGRHAWAAWSTDGRLLRRGALKTLLHWAADEVPRMKAPNSRQ